MHACNNNMSVEFSSFEHQKENIQPVKSGRDASKLKDAFDSEMDEKQRAEKLLLEREYDIYTYNLFQSIESSRSA